jgi:L-idonate 5-dehydrogenase
MSGPTSALAATVFAPEDLRVVEHALPPLETGMVRISFGAGGVCGSDMHYYKHAKNGDFVIKTPLILGHEIAGEVREINGRVPGLAVGDRVAVNPSRWCEGCGYCRAGQHELCERIYFMGSASRIPHMQGGFATCFDALPQQCVKVPAGLPMEAAAMAEPVAVCLHAVKRAGEIKGRSVLVVGAGPIGLITMMVARMKGAASLTVADIAKAPLAFANRLGADVTINVKDGDQPLREAALMSPFDIAFEASGAPAGLASAIHAVRRGGTLVQIGNLPAGAVPVPVNQIMSKEIDMRGTFRFGKVFEEAVDAIVGKRIDVMSLVTSRHRLVDARAALALSFDRTRSMKVVITA